MREQLRCLVEKVERGGHVTLSERPAPSGPPVNVDARPGQIGTSLATPTGARRPAPPPTAAPTALDGSVNMFDEDDE